MGKGDKFLKWLGIKSEIDDDYLENSYALPSYDNDSTPGSSPTASSSSSSGTSNNLVSLQGGSNSGKQVRVIVSEPDDFEEVQALADHLKNRRQIILNFELAAPDVSQRIIDFLSGTLYAIDGHSQQLGKHIFLFAPSNTEIMKEARISVKKPAAVVPPTTPPGLYNPGGNR